MTTHISKEELALMMPGTLYHYFHDEPEYRVATPAPKPGVFARIASAVSDWSRRRAEANELAGLSDEQLADIGLSRSELPLVFDPEFAARRNNERVVGRVQNGCVSPV